MARRTLFALLFAAAALSATGCATVDGTDGARRHAAGGPATAAAVYEAGRRALAAGDYDAAVRHFRALEIDYPDDPYTTQGQMELAYVYYKTRDFASAIATTERFIRDHPDHPDLDYLYYLRGRASFDQAVAALTEDTAEIRPKPPVADLALQYFSELIARFPDSRYSTDARNRIIHLQDRIARFELENAKRYLNRGDYANAGLYARSVVENYPSTAAAAEAAAVTNMAYHMLDLEGGKPAAGQPPPQEDEPQTAPSPPATPAGRVRGAEWIAAQDPGSYTIQLLSTTNEQALLAFIDRHRLQDVAYFQNRRPDGVWYSLLYGVFKDAEDARAAAEKLPPTLRGERPWIRRLGEIQAVAQPASKPPPAPREAGR